MSAYEIGFIVGEIGFLSILLFLGGWLIRKLIKWEKK